MSSFAAKAGVTLDGTGNWRVVGGGNGDVTPMSPHLSLTVEPGASMGRLDLVNNPPNFAVDVGVGATLTGDDAVAGQDVGNISLVNRGILTGSGAGGSGVYGFGGDVTINLNASGASIVGGMTGIDTVTGGTLRILDNSGLIRGIGSSGILSGNSTFVVNSGTIEGLSNADASGVIFNLNGQVINSGVIRGDGSGVNGGIDGIIDNRGAIIGQTGGIFLASGADISNGDSGTIAGVSGDGIRAGDGSTIRNRGTISSEAFNGLDMALDATITNSGTIRGQGASGVGFLSGGGMLNLNNQATGLIRGGTHGLLIHSLLTSGLTHITNSGTIEGDAGSGVNASGIADLNILTQPTGTIRATGGAGILAGEGFILRNHGEVHGDATSSAGIEVEGTRLNLTNTRLIDGSQGLFVVSDATDPGTGVNVTNTGGSAVIEGIAGDGVNAQGGLVLHNLSGATIKSTGGNGVNAGPDFVLRNNGASFILGDSGSGTGLLSAGGVLQVQNLAGSTIQGHTGISITGATTAGTLAHTIRNEGASLIKGLGGNGIKGLDGLTIGNLGASTIQSAGANAIKAGTGATILNTQASNIQGSSGASGIETAGGAVKIENLIGASITGGNGVLFTGATSAPAGGGPNLLNNNSTIEGLAGHGVGAQNTLVLHNLAGGIVKATGGDGVNAGLDAIVMNNGGSLIRGDLFSGSGISSAGGAVNIENRNSSTISGGTGITFTGAVSGSGPHVLNNNSTISGLAGNGITGIGGLVVHNLSGATIRATGADGIHSIHNTQGLTVLNRSSSIHGDAASGSGISGAGGAFSLTNTSAGIVNGATGVRITIDVTGSGPHILNEGASHIEGFAGDGINAQGGLFITNQGTSFIKATGGSGITAGDSLILRNITASQITSTGGDGVDTGLDASIYNTNIIRGDLATGVGVRSAGGAITLQNLTGAVIEGQRGIVVTGDASPLTAGEVHIRNNASSITGHDGHGIEAAGGLIVRNEAAGTITATRSLTLNGADGIHAGDDLAVTNTGASTIRGDAAAGWGIQSTGGQLRILNEGNSTITGMGGIRVTGDAIPLSGDAPHILNRSALIEGLAGDGIHGAGGLVIQNLAVIRGSDDGIETGDDNTILNEATICGTGGHGVFAGQRLNLTNSAGASITGSVDGIRTGSTATIVQHSTVTGLGGDGINAGDDLDLTNTSSVQGASNGVSAGSGATIRNTATIEGLAAAGVSAQDGLQLTNEATGLVRGATHAITARDAATVENDGRIIAGSGAGVQARNGLDLTNRADITGTLGVDTSAATAGGGGRIENRGTITATNKAIVTGAGDDTIEQYGTLVSGSGTDMELGGGDDLVTLHDAVISGGRIYGGAHGANGDHLVLNGVVVLNADVLQMERTDAASSGSSKLISGKILESDTVSINAGQFHLDGLIRGSTGAYAAVIIEPDARLSGDGSTAGSLTLKPGAFIDPGSLTVNSLGSLTFSRDALLDTDSTFLADLDGDSKTSDLIRSETTATVRGRIVIRQQGFFERGDRYTVVSAPQVLGSFATVENADITPTLKFYQETAPVKIDFAVKAHMADIPRLTPHELTIARYLDRITTEGTPRLRAILIGLDYSGNLNIQRALSKIDPVIYNASGTVALNHAHQFSQSEAQRLEFLRQRGQSPAPAAAPAEGSKNPAPVAVTAADKDFSLWFSLATSGLHQSSSEEVDGITARMTGLTVGADTALNSLWSVGAYASVWEDNFDAGPWGSEGDTTTLLLGAHATAGHATGLYLDAALAVGWGSSDMTHRYPGVTGAGSSHGDYDSTLWRASLGTGYRWEKNGWRFGPMARFEHVSMDEDSLDERGSGLDLHISGRQRESNRLEVGFTASHEQGLMLGRYRAKPFGSLRFAHEFSAQDEEITANLLEADVGDFRVRGQNLSESSLIFTLGVGMDLSPRTTLHFSYTHEHGLDSHSDSRNTADLTVSVAF